MANPSANEEEKQAALLHTAVGEAGSGAARYAAAMHFFQHGKMSCHDLEIFRSLAKDDLTDPTPLLMDQKP